MPEQLSFWATEDPPDVESSAIVSVSNGRRRVRFSVWLEIDNPVQLELAEALFSLKRLRAFAPTLRAALALYLDLKAGQTDELARQFPFALQNSVDISPLQEQLARVENKILSLSAGSVTAQPAPIRGYEPPIDLEDTIVVSEASLGDENPVFNMLISVASLDVTGFIGLDLEVLEYGIKQGKIPAYFLEQKRKLKASANSSRKVDTSDSGEVASDPKKMDTPDLEAPEFDDLDDLEGLWDAA